MIKEVSTCVGCGIAPCQHCRGTVYVCDCCEEEVDELFWSDDEQLCKDCFLEVCLDNAEKVR